MPTERKGFKVPGGIKRAAKHRAAGTSPSANRAKPLGQRLIANLEKLIGTMKSGGMAAVEKTFTVRRVEVSAFPRPDLTAADVAAIRKAVGVSQAVFAALLGANIGTVRAWEQGVNPPSGIALRFLAEIRADPKYWMARVAAASGS